MSKKDWQLLKAYQATGLTPEEVERVKRERDAMRNCKNCEFPRGGLCEHMDRSCFNCEAQCPCKRCFALSEWRFRGVKEGKG